MPIQPYPSLSIECQNCNWQKDVSLDNFTKDAKELLNGKSIGWLFKSFICGNCSKGHPSIRDKKGELLLGGDDISICRIGDHQIPLPQRHADPNKSSCIHCLEKREKSSQDARKALPRLINAGPCPNCTKANQKDPIEYAHRVGVLGYHLDNDGVAWAQCSIWAFMKKGTCRFRRHLTPDDNVQESDTYDEKYIEIFKEDIFEDDNLSNSRSEGIPDLVSTPNFREPADKLIEENLEKELKSFSIKLEELNKAFEELKEKLSNP
jgi:hypothetical protein